MQSKFEMDNGNVNHVIMRVMLLDWLFKLEYFVGGEISVTVHIIDKVECKTIIDFLCTDWISAVYFCFKVPYFMCE